MAGLPGQVEKKFMPLNKIPYAMLVSHIRNIDRDLVFERLNIE